MCSAAEQCWGPGAASCPGGATPEPDGLLRTAVPSANNARVGSLDYYRAAPGTAMASDISGRWYAEVVNRHHHQGRSTAIDMSACGGPTARVGRHRHVDQGHLPRRRHPDWAAPGFVGHPLVQRLFLDEGCDPDHLRPTGRMVRRDRPGPFFSVKGNALSVDMSAFHRPTAHGSRHQPIDDQHDVSDDRTNTSRLESPNVIRWSDGSFWTKL